jgi:hypothetical protein
MLGEPGDDPPRAGEGDRHILSVAGRKTGQPHSTPVDVMEQGGRRWLVAPYGVTNWVRNARAAGEVNRQGSPLRDPPDRGGGARRQRPGPLAVLREVPVIRPYFDVSLKSSDEEFAAEAPRHPVFRLISPPG